MTANVKFAKVKEGAIIPSKRDEDMGFDIYACFDEDYIKILPHETKLIPTGIASACDPEYGFILFERGSTGSKGIARRCGIIDSGYRNEWFIGLTNTTNNLLIIAKEDADYKDEVWLWNKLYPSSRVTIYSYTKAIAQALVMPVPKVKVEEFSYHELKEIKSERGMGALGSSNK